MVTETAQSCRADEGNEASSSSSSSTPAHKSSSRVAAKLAEARHAADHCSEWADQIEVAGCAPSGHGICQACGTSSDSQRPCIEEAPENSMSRPSKYV